MEEIELTRAGQLRLTMPAYVLPLMVFFSVGTSVSSE